MFPVLLKVRPPKRLFLSLNEIRKNNFSVQPLPPMIDPFSKITITEEDTVEAKGEIKVKDEDGAGEKAKTKGPIKSEPKN